MNRPTYLAGKDAEYHILRISINRFTKVLDGLRVNDLRKKHDYYLDFCSRFLVDLWLLLFHGSDDADTGASSIHAHTSQAKHVQVTLLLFTDSGVEP